MGRTIVKQHTPAIPPGFLQELNTELMHELWFTLAAAKHPELNSPARHLPPSLDELLDQLLKDLTWPQFWAAFPYELRDQGSLDEIDALGLLLSSSIARSRFERHFEQLASSTSSASTNRSSQQLHNAQARSGNGAGGGSSSSRALARAFGGAPAPRQQQQQQERGHYAYTGPAVDFDDRLWLNRLRSDALTGTVGGEADWEILARFEAADAAAAAGMSGGGAAGAGAAGGDSGQQQQQQQQQRRIPRRRLLPVPQLVRQQRQQLQLGQQNVAYVSPAAPDRTLSTIVNAGTGGLRAPQWSQQQQQQQPNNPTNRLRLAPGGLTRALRPRSTLLQQQQQAGAAQQQRRGPGPFLAMLQRQQQQQQVQEQDEGWEDEEEEEEERDLRDQLNEQLWELLHQHYAADEMPPPPPLPPRSAFTPPLLPRRAAPAAAGGRGAAGAARAAARAAAGGPVPTSPTPPAYLLQQREEQDEELYWDGAYGDDGGGGPALQEQRRQAALNGLPVPVGPAADIEMLLGRRDEPQMASAPVPVMRPTHSRYLQRQQEQQEVVEAGDWTGVEEEEQEEQEDEGSAGDDEEQEQRAAAMVAILQQYMLDRQRDATATARVAAAAGGGGGRWGATPLAAAAAGGGGSLQGRAAAAPPAAAAAAGGGAGASGQRLSGQRRTWQEACDPEGVEQQQQQTQTQGQQPQSSSQQQQQAAGAADAAAAAAAGAGTSRRVDYRRVWRAVHEWLTGEDEDLLLLVSQIVPYSLAGRGLRPEADTLQQLRTKSHSRAVPPKVVSRIAERLHQPTPSGEGHLIRLTASSGFSRQAAAAAAVLQCAERHGVLPFYIPLGGLCTEDEVEAAVMRGLFGAPQGQEQQLSEAAAAAAAAASGYEDSAGGSSGAGGGGGGGESSSSLDAAAASGPSQHAAPPSLSAAAAAAAAGLENGTRRRNSFSSNSFSSNRSSGDLTLADMGAMVAMMESQAAVFGPPALPSAAAAAGGAGAGQPSGGAIMPAHLRALVPHQAAAAAAAAGAGVAGARVTPTPGLRRQHVNEFSLPPRPLSSGHQITSAVASPAGRLPGSGGSRADRSSVDVDDDSNSSSGIMTSSSGGAGGAFIDEIDQLPAHLTLLGRCHSKQPMLLLLDEVDAAMTPDDGRPLRNVLVLLLHHLPQAVVVITSSSGVDAWRDAAVLRQVGDPVVESLYDGKLVLVEHRLPRSPLHACCYNFRM